MISYAEIIGKFRQSILDAGIPIEVDIIADGEIHRFFIPGDKTNNKNGWYLLHADGIPAGEFGSWKTGYSEKWSLKKTSELTVQQRSDMQNRIEESKARRKKESSEKHKKAAELASIIWEAGEPISEHPYLTAKNVESYGLKLGSWPNRKDKALLIPIRKNKKIISLQGIFGDCSKWYFPGGEKKGSYATIGRGEPTPTIIICEGYSTGATIHKATDLTVVIAFDSGNLFSVAESIAEKQPEKRIFIAADNDQFSDNNVGVNKAKAAGRVVGNAPIIPEFKTIDDKPTDFNDLARLEGIEEVKRQIETAIKTEIIEPPKPSQELASIDYFSYLPDVSGNANTPLPTIANLEEIAGRLNVTIRYNVITKENEIIIPGKGFTIDNEANASLAWFMSECGRFKMPTGKLKEFIPYIADQNLYNPVYNWIMSKPWDGVSRLQPFYDTIVSAGGCQRLKEMLMNRWLLSAVAAVFEPNGVSAHGVLVLQGAQYKGKTNWFKKLAPAKMGVIQDGLILRPDDKDSVKQAVSNWIVELGELDATFRKSDIAQLKAFITRDKDVLRRPYAPLDSHYARRTVFFASVNPDRFLHDPTGNRRYWTVPCVDIDHEHGVDMQQLWREVHAKYEAGEKWFLTQSEFTELNAHNLDHEMLDPIKEKLLMFYDWTSDQSKWQERTASQVMHEIGYERPTRSELTSCGHFIKELNGGQTRKTNGRKVSRVPRKLI